MATTLQVERFKSIKYLKIDCHRINLFIGKPNTGKSNILESVGVFSIPFLSYTNNRKLTNLIRCESPINLFYDNEVGESIVINYGESSFSLEYKMNSFTGKIVMPQILPFDFYFNHELNVHYSLVVRSPIKFYKFSVRNTFAAPDADYLLPPDGANLLQILMVNKGLRKVVSELFLEYGLRVVLKPQEGRIEVQKEAEDLIFAYPYSIVSDTLQRLVFYLTAIETNQNSTLIFEEPESHAFPYWTKFLAEKIALDKSNSYFISTHNPYLLLSILEKAPQEDIAVFITYFEDFQTKVRPLKETELNKILDLDASIFFNLDSFLEE